MKTCSRCRISKPRTEFGRIASYPDGLNYYCRLCANLAGRAWRARHPEVNTLRGATLKLPGEKRNQHLARMRRAHNKRRHGLSVEEYDRLLAEYGDFCAICGCSLIRSKRCHIDHDHRTNEIRGVLCNKCNMAIGLLRERPDLLKAAELYLRQGGVLPAAWQEAS